MIIKLFNFWYFFWIIISIGTYVGLHFLLRNKSDKIKKITLFSILALALILHFTKAFYPPYSTDLTIKYRTSWFINICAANICLFPFIFLSKSKRAKDYMIFIGIISGLIATFYPEEPMAKANQLAEQLDIIRFYIHHFVIWAVPLLMVTLNLHKISYKGIFNAPIGLLAVMLFIMLNQILQAELGFIPMRSNDFFNINYKNTSFIWGPGKAGDIGQIFTIFCPEFFKTVPVGEYAGQEKYWPWFWMIVPVFVLITPLAFIVSMVFDHKNFVKDVKTLITKIKNLFLKLKKNK